MLLSSSDKIQVSSQEQIHDIKQSIMELPPTIQYSCFHLEHNGERINDFIQLSEVKGLTSETQLTLIEDPYTEKDARIHVIRVRELIGAAGDRTDTLQGILAGLSLHDSVSDDWKSSGTSTPPNQSPIAPHPIIDYEFQTLGSLSTLLPGTQAPSFKTV